MDSPQRCPTCPTNEHASEPELAVWCWFDMLADEANGILPKPNDQSEAAYLLDGSCTQAGIELKDDERPDALLATQGLISCFYMRATGQCPVANLSSVS